MMEKAALGWLATNRSETDTDMDEIQDNVERVIHEGDIAAVSVLQYADWLVTTTNECIPYETWRIPDPHPCTLNVKDITDTNDDDYYNLVNTVQRHTRCSPAYCLHEKPGQQEQKYRFDQRNNNQHYNLRSFKMAPFVQY